MAGKYIEIDALEPLEINGTTFAEKIRFIAFNIKGKNFTINDEDLFQLFLNKNTFFVDSIDDTGFTQITGTNVQAVFNSIDDLFETLIVTTIPALDARVTANEGDITTHALQIGVNQSNIDINATNIDLNQTNITNNANAITALDGRVTTNEADILALQGVVSSVAVQIVAISTNTNGVASRLYAADTSSGDVTITLPASPNDNDVIKFSKRDASPNNLIVDGNGKTIDGDATVFTNNQYTTSGVQYSTALGEWVIVG